MAETFILKNVGSGQVSFIVHPPVDLNWSLPKHHRRRMLREGAVSVMIPRSSTVDLVALTGLPASVLKGLPEVMTILRSPYVRLLAPTEEAPSVVVESVVIPKPPVLEVKEPEKVEVPVVEAPSVPAPVGMPPMGLPPVPDAFESFKSKPKGKKGTETVSKP